MRALVGALYVLAVIADLAGFALLVNEARKADRELVAWNDANPNENADGSNAQILLLNRVVNGLLGSRRKRALAVVLVALGIVSGAAANFMSLAD